MNMNISRASAVLSPLLALALSSCVGFTIKPPKPTGMPRADKPIPLKVGVLSRAPQFEMHGVGMSAERMRGYRMFRPVFAQADDVGGKFTRALQAANAFSSVENVSSLAFNGAGGGHDILIESDFRSRYVQDPATMGKAFMTGFLLLIPAPFVRYEDSFGASAVVSVYDSSGRLIQKYSEETTARASAALFSAGSAGSISAGIDAAATQLAARLVASILADREGWSRAIAGRPAVAARPAPPPPAETAAAAPATVEARAEEAHKELDAADRPMVAPAAAPSAAAGNAMFAPAAGKAVEPMVTTQAPAAAAPAPAAEPEPVVKSEAPKPKRRGPLTAAEERAIDEELLP